jgi:hypothetical protein
MSKYNSNINLDDNSEEGEKLTFGEAGNLLFTGEARITGPIGLGNELTAATFNAGGSQSMVVAPGLIGTNVSFMSGGGTLNANNWLESDTKFADFNKLKSLIGESSDSSMNDLYAEGDA